MNQRGEVTVVVLVVVAVLGGVVAIWKPSWLPGASKRAATATKTTEALVQATDHQSAVAAASVQTIGSANADAPDSPAKDFISREVPYALTLLAKPDPKALVDAEKRKVAVMEGKLDVALKLYNESAKVSAKLQAERDEAIQEKRESDLALEKAAAAEHARTMQLFGAGLIALILGGAWVWLKLNGISTQTFGEMAARIHKGEKAIEVFDEFLPKRIQKKVNRVARLSTPTPNE